MARKLTTKCACGGTFRNRGGTTITNGMQTKYLHCSNNCGKSLRRTKRAHSK